MSTSHNVTSQTRPPLIDTFGRTHDYLRISVTERCNLRCVYCMPAEGIDLVPRAAILSFEEIIRLVNLFASMGISKIRLTGGEPLIRKALPTLISKIRKIPQIKTIAMTTNGVLLSKHIDALKSAGLDKINLSLDTLREERFEKIARREHFSDVMAGLHKSLETGFTPLKINMVPLLGVNDDEILDFVALAKDKPIDIRFIEFMPFDQNQWREEKLFTYKQMQEIISKKYHLIASDRSPNDVATTYNIDGFIGSVSFISSMTNSFCSGCNRIRLLADGAIKNCLFSNNEISLRDAMRQGATDDDLEMLIRTSIQKKKEAHDPMATLHKLPNRSMIKIGG